jgi:hypothetical protein
MKSYPTILLFLVSLFVFSCTDNLTDIGAGIQPTSDQIAVGTDTFNVSTSTIPVDFIYSKPDSFLLGSYYDTKFGSTQADILAQVNCPVGFKFPALSEPDSATVVLTYRTWFGQPGSPMEISVYEMNKNTFNYTGLYPSNLDPSVYADHDLFNPTNLLAKLPVKAKDTKRADSTSVRLPLSASFVKRFFDTSNFSSTTNFLQFFKGMYITTNFGASSLLNVNNIYINYYYHYTYTTKDANGNTVVDTVKNVIPFPANAEVRQVNHFVHPNQATVPKPDNTVDYVASPANWNTTVGIPLNRIKTRMDAGIANKKLTINSAVIKVEAVDVDVDTLRAPTVMYMLLIKEEAINRFFNNNELPSDTCAMLAGHAVALIANSTTQYEDYYKFSVAKLIANELKIAKDKNIPPVESLSLRLIPVSVIYDANGSPTSVKHDYNMSAVTIRSGLNPDSRMKIKVVYSGF